jgi:non-heme chloroperoxidase
MENRRYRCRYPSIVPPVTETRKIPNRGHSLTMDSGWREVAETALEFVKRFV